MNLLGENPATELEDINQEIADLQKAILAGVKAHWDVTELAERVQELRSRKTEIEAVHMKTSQFNIESILPSRTIGTVFLFRPESIEVVLDRRDNPKYNNSRYSITR